VVDLVPENDGLALVNFVLDRLRARFAPGVRRFEKLGGRLTKVAYHAFGCGAFCRVGDRVQVDSALVGAVHEDVESLLGFDALLLVAEYEVDPLVKMLAYVVTLQRLD